MKGLVVFDSEFGNTRTVAEAIAGTLGYQTALVSEFPSERLLGYKHIIFGSPTQKFRATPAMLRFITSLPFGCLADARVSAFDTHMDAGMIELKQREFEVHIPSHQIEMKLPHPVTKMPAVNLGVKISGVDAQRNVQVPISKMRLPMGKMTGYAAGIMAFLLRDTGAILAGKPDGFFVEDIAGPLKDGELDRTIEWARNLS